MWREEGGRGRKESLRTARPSERGTLPTVEVSRAFREQGRKTIVTEELPPVFQGPDFQ